MRPAASLTTGENASHRAEQLGAGAWFVFLACLALRRLFTSDASVGLPADDFYYYLVPAKQLVHTGISTFDGVTWTNGYQPLWFLVVVLLVLASGDSDPLLFALLGVVNAMLCALIFVQVRRVSLQLRLAPSLAVAVGLAWSAYAA
jgi:hypothetical protein